MAFIKLFSTMNRITSLMQPTRKLTATLHYTVKCYLGRR